MRRSHPRDTKRRRERLRERGQIDDAVVAIVGLDRPGFRCRRGVLEVQFAVRIVLDDRHAFASRPLQQAQTLLETQRRSRRILEVRRHVQELHAPPFLTHALQHFLQIIQIDAIRLLLDADQHRSRFRNAAIAPV